MTNLNSIFYIFTTLVFFLSPPATSPLNRIPHPWWTDEGPGRLGGGTGHPDLTGLGRRSVIKLWNTTGHGTQHLFFSKTLLSFGFVFGIWNMT